jgi:esterase/lipase
MGKRQPISFDNGELVSNLKTSAGNGLDALFSSAPQSKTETPKKEPVKVIKKKTKKAEVTKEKKEIKQTSNITNNIASNIVILQFTEDEIEKLKEPAYMVQTYRLTQQEIEWVKDTAYRLSKELKRGKVSQADVLRIALKLFGNLLESNKADLIKILEKIK